MDLEGPSTQEDEDDNDEQEATEATAQVDTLAATSSGASRPGSLLGAEVLVPFVAMMIINSFLLRLFCNKGHGFLLFDVVDQDVDVVGDLVCSQCCLFSLSYSTGFFLEMLSSNLLRHLLMLVNVLLVVCC